MLFRSRYQDVLEQFSNVDLMDPESAKGKQTIKVGGLISEMKIHYTKRGNKEMAFVTIEGLQGQAELVVFPDIFAETKHLIKPDKMIFVEGKISDQNRDDDQIKLLADTIIPLEQAQEKYARSLHINLEVDKMRVTDIEDLKRLMARYDGDCDILFHLNTATKNTRLIKPKNFTVGVDAQLIHKLRERFGHNNVFIE